LSLRTGQPYLAFPKQPYRTLPNGPYLDSKLVYGPHEPLLNLMAFSKWPFQSYCGTPRGSLTFWPRIITWHVQTPLGCKRGHRQSGERPRNYFQAHGPREWKKLERGWDPQRCIQRESNASGFSILIYIRCLGMECPGRNNKG
jgi:hypothetical protein